MKKKEIYQIQFVGETRRGNDRVGTTWSCEVFGICPLHKVTNKMKEKKTDRRKSSHYIFFFIA